jgi:hypothetical protein
MCECTIIQWFCKILSPENKNKIIRKENKKEENKKKLMNILKNS